MKKNIILSIYMLLMVSKLFSSDFMGVRHDFPIDVNIEVSKNEIMIGDSIEINVSVKLRTDHPNYEKGKRYGILKMKTIQYLLMKYF